MNTVATIKLQGKDYAQVKDRLMEFREKNPNGFIETTPTIQENGQILFKARVLKDKSDPNSAEATGHSLGVSKNNKDFEKLETIAVGRALALLGYASSGEVASSEEMEEFYKFQSEKREARIEEYSDKIKKAKDLRTLQRVWASIDGSIRSELVGLKDTQKKKLSENVKV